ncbi:hypothetical protein [Flavobacterium aquicola]|uniref:HEAT repeat protein n=1 Tax=Flavobacterium aquicola TaxID=1682742 RepID=A0A3E0ESJ9_9FLAO|nr:hypothetical protein [Flavobacterium aquicola]REH01235.1 hypothetical protein C8P67_102502 [Flavobacterium aquicola]
MIKFWELYENGDWVKPFLILSISLFIAASFILYLLIIRSRSKNIRKDRLRIEYSTFIEKFMFALVFQDTPFSSIKEDKDYEEFSKTSFFREVLMDSIINLHKNYEGIYAKKLEQFYKDSGLINDSFKKLRSLKWEIKCKGITELAELNVAESFGSIMKVSKARNKTLKITALNACIKLAGIKGIEHLTEHQHPIDDWTQLNIIHAFKKHDIGDIKGVELLLESKNTTVVILGLKLIKELKLSQKLPYVTQLAAVAPNIQVKYIAQDVLQTLTV